MNVEKILSVRLGDYLPAMIEKNPAIADKIVAPRPDCPHCYGRGHTGVMNGTYVRCKCTRKNKWN